MIPIKYDFKKYRKYNDFWNRGKDGLGLHIGGHHHICALWEVKQGFSLSHYNARIARVTMPKIDVYGRKTMSDPNIKVPTIEDLMELDMDLLMSAAEYNGVDSQHPPTVTLYTNDTEDPRWLDLLKRCPHAQKVYSVPSKMGHYMVHAWVICREKRNAV